MAHTVAAHLVDTLAQAGVRRVYGLVGDSLNPVTDAIRRSGSVQWVHVRHEETAAFAAGAEAQLTGRLCPDTRTRSPPPARRPAARAGWSARTPTTGVINAFLAQFAAELPADVHAAMVLDRAGCHKAGGLQCRGEAASNPAPTSSPRWHDRRDLLDEAGDLGGRYNPNSRIWTWLPSRTRRETVAQTRRRLPAGAVRTPRKITAASSGGPCGCRAVDQYAANRPRSAGASPARTAGPP